MYNRNPQRRKKWWQGSRTDTKTYNLTELKTDLELHFERAQHMPENIDTARPTLRHSLVKLLNFKGKIKILQTSKQNQVRKISLLYFSTVKIYERRSVLIMREFMRKDTIYYGIPYLRYSRKHEPNILHITKLFFKYKSHKLLSVC